jgi:hypothetical protein
VSGSNRRFEVPRGLSSEEERAIVAALERYFENEAPSSDPWAFAGRLDATGMGALQTRRTTGAWQRAGRSGFTRRGIMPFTGRGDAR